MHLRASSHYAVCTDSGVIFRSSRIVCASVNAVIAPGNGTKQPSRDRLDEVISARLQTIRVPIQRSVKAKRAGNGTHLLLCSKNQNCSVELLVNSNGSPARGSGFIYILFRGFSNPRCLHSPVSARIAERRFSAAPARRAERGDRRAADHELRSRFAPRPRATLCWPRGLLHRALLRGPGAVGRGISDFFFPR